MELEKRINAFVELGKFLTQFEQIDPVKDSSVKYNDLFFDGFKHQLKLAEETNGWFTKDNLIYSLKGWSNQLTYSNINTFILKYDMTSISCNCSGLFLDLTIISPLLISMSSSSVIATDIGANASSISPESDQKEITPDDDDKINKEGNSGFFQSIKKTLKIGLDPEDTSPN